MTAALKPRHRLFVTAILAGSAGKAAALAAGYPPKSARQRASDLLRRPDVKAAIREGQAETAERVQVDRGLIVSRLVALSRIAPVECPHCGSAVPVEVSPAVAERALSTLARIQGLC